MGDIIELKVVSRLCFSGRWHIADWTREELEYVKHLIANGFAKLRGGYVEPSKRLCELYEQYLACYNNISKKCEWPYGRIHECWMEEWARCLSLLP